MGVVDSLQTLVANFFHWYTNSYVKIILIKLSIDYVCVYMFTCIRVLAMPFNGLLFQSEEVAHVSGAGCFGS